MRQECLLVDLTREESPLVHHITNYVTVNDCANVTLAMGASPVMADSPDEAAEIADISAALVINIGTLNERTLRSALIAGRRANGRGIPVVFDPVGVGCSKLRSEATERILGEIKCAAVRCNMSEANVLIGRQVMGKGVDAAPDDLLAGVRDTLAAARTISSTYDTVCAITGAVDVVSGRSASYIIENGHPLMGKITGTGCMCTSLAACMCGSTDNYLAAAVCAVAAMGAAGEIAYHAAGRSGLGSYRVSLIDAVSNLTSASLAKMERISETQD